MLKKAGFKKKDLKKKETALAIYEILLREVEFDNLQTKSIGPQNGPGSARGRQSTLIGTKDLVKNRISGRPESS